MKLKYSVLLILILSIYLISITNKEIVAQEEPPVTITVIEGETLWDLAVRLYPNEDPRYIVYLIRDLNNIPKSSYIQIGQSLKLPREGLELE